MLKLFRWAREKNGKAPVRLHIGSGTESLPGWINIDSQKLPGVDRVLDVRRGLPFEAVASIYAEHFLEHLGLDAGLAFLRECRRVLSERGTLRLSTPNLDWVYATHYHPGQWPNEAEELHDAMQLNRAFRGWGHQFLYNRATLAAALRSAGFGEVTFCSYGNSELPEFAGIERHETWQDSPDLPHVLVVEVSGRSEPVEFPAVELADYRRDIGSR